jgi:hypothetical protein
MRFAFVSSERSEDTLFAPAAAAVAASGDLSSDYFLRIVEKPEV